MTVSTSVDLALVPGSGCDARLFKAQADALAGETRVHGVGNTAEPRIETPAHRALAGLPDRFALAGLSQGGVIALDMIRQAPERVVGLALLDALPGPGLRVDRVRHRMAIALLAVRACRPMDAMIWPRYVAPAHLDDQALHAIGRSMARDTGARGLINQQRIFLTRPDYRPLLSSISVPTLVLVGEHDTLAPPEAAATTADAISTADLVFVAGSGHLSTLEAPNAVTAALHHWLARVRTQPSSPQPSTYQPSTSDLQGPLS